MAEQQTDEKFEPDEILAAIKKRGRKGLTIQQLVNQLAAERKIGRSEARQLLRPGLKQLQHEGRIVLGRGKRYFPAGASDLVTGRLRRAPGGHAEVLAEDDHGPPVRIPPRGHRGALDGDLVLVRLEKPRKRARADGVREGVVVRVLERVRREVVGRWVVGGGRPHVRPIDRRLRFTVTPTESRVRTEPTEGELVVISVDTVDSRGQHARGALLERLGNPTDPGVVERAVLRLHGIPVEFPPEALAEAGHPVHPVVVYSMRATPPRELPPLGPNLEAVILTSPRAARLYLDAVGGKPLPLQHWALGPTTRDAAGGLGIECAIPSEPTMYSLAEELCQS